MDSGFFELDLPDEILERVSSAAAGRRFSFPGHASKHNPFYRRKRNQQICRRGEEGATISELVAEFRLSDRHIKRILSDNGVQIRSELSMRKKINTIKAMLLLNRPKTEIAEKIGVSRQRVYQIIKQEGLG